MSGVLYPDYGGKSAYYSLHLIAGYAVSDNNWHLFNKWLDEWAFKNQSYMAYIRYNLQVPDYELTGVEKMLIAVKNKLEYWANEEKMGMPDLSAPLIKSSQHSFAGFGKDAGPGTDCFYGSLAIDGRRYYFFDKDPYLVLIKTVICLIFVYNEVKQWNKKRQHQPRSLNY